EPEAMPNRVVEWFIEGDVDRVIMVYNRYISPLTQVVETVDLLPVPRTVLDDDEAQSAHDLALDGHTIYEPEPEESLARLLPACVETTISRALLESAASE